MREECESLGTLTAFIQVVLQLVVVGVQPLDSVSTVCIILILADQKASGLVGKQASVAGAATESIKLNQRRVARSRNAGILTGTNLAQVELVQPIAVKLLNLVLALHTVIGVRVTQLDIVRDDLSDLLVEPVNGVLVLVVVCSNTESLHYTLSKTTDSVTLVVIVTFGSLKTAVVSLLDLEVAVTEDFDRGKLVRVVLSLDAHEGAALKQATVISRSSTDNMTAGTSVSVSEVAGDVSNPEVAKAIQ